MSEFKKSTKTQSIIFDREKWTVEKAKKWLKDHKKKVSKVDTTTDFHRFRQLPVNQFDKSTFRTIPLGGSSGIKAIIAVPKDGTAKRNPTKEKSPWLPALLVDLATPVSIDIEGGDQLKFPFAGRYSLAANRSGTELWILSKKGGKNVHTTDEKGERLYEDFTGFEHDEVGTMVQVRPKSLTKIGRAMNIVYKSDKFSRPGHVSSYIHAFSHYPIVSVDNVNRPTVVALRGGRIKVKKEGITG
jgi:hypothetical protein